MFLMLNVPLFMKKEALSLSCKASRRALLPRLPRTDVRPNATFQQYNWQTR